MLLHKIDPKQIPQIKIIDCESYKRPFTKSKPLSLQMRGLSDRKLETKPRLKPGLLILRFFHELAHDLHAL